MYQAPSLKVSLSECGSNDESLRQVLSSERAGDISLLLRITQQITEVLVKVHQSGLVLGHLDVEHIMCQHLNYVSISFHTLHSSFIPYLVINTSTLEPPYNAVFRV